MMPITATVALLGLTACFSTNDRTAGRVMDDSKITDRVQTKLDHSPVYKFEDVKIATHNGVVQLSGWTTTEEQKAMAADLARRADGVVEVINNISLKLAPTGHGPNYPYTTNAPPHPTNAIPPEAPAPTTPPQKRDY